MATVLAVESTLKEAQELLRQIAAEQPEAVALTTRLDEVGREILVRGTYTQTYEELAWSARIAWRNNSRCVGRHYWQGLMVRDCRSLTSGPEIFEALVEHLRLSTNGGSIRPTITVFAPESANGGPRIWNEQLIRYAGYRLPDGSVVGDPRQVELTDAVRRLGWRGGPGTRFDILPVVIETPATGPRLYELPRDAVLEVPISHPDLPWFADLALRWHALPAISGMMLDAGGVRYTAAPFSGWYLGTEVATRNLADEARYDQLPVIARRMGLDMRREDSLWRDRALVELNFAVLHSFRQAGVRITDHHTVTRHFVTFEDRELEQGREIFADWSWIVPPTAGSTTPVFHRQYRDATAKPNFFWLPEPWRRQGAAGGCPFAAG
jgi:nitric-oxide synthase